MHMVMGTRQGQGGWLSQQVQGLTQDPDGGVCQVCGCMRGDSSKHKLTQPGSHTGHGPVGLTSGYTQGLMQDPNGRDYWRVGV